MLANFTSHSKGKETFVTVSIEDRLVKQLGKKTKRSSGKKIEDPGVLKRIVLDALGHMKNPPQDLKIKVTGIKGKNVTYTIEQEKKHPLHKVALHHFNAKQAIKGITENKIVSVSQLTKNMGVETLLEHFSQLKDKSPGLFARIKALIINFFRKIMSKFKWTQALWEAITHDSAKMQAKFRWDLDLLASTCGVAPEREISVTQALHYMTGMMKREGEKFADPKLFKRISDGAKLGTQQDRLRKRFSERGFKKLRGQIQKSATHLKQGRKMLMPVSYMKEGALVQMLMEIGKEKDGTYSVALISQSDEARKMFDHELGIKNSQSSRREIVNVQENDLLAMLSLVLELDTAPQCHLSDSKQDWELMFMQAFKLPKTTVKVGKVTDTFAQGLSPSHVGETLSYLAKQKKTPLEVKRFELAARLQIFLDLTKKDETMLKDPGYWKLVRTSAYQLARMIENNQEILGASESRGSEMTRIFYELNQRLEKLNTNLPELVDLQKQAAPYFSSGFEISPEPPLLYFGKVETELNIFPDIHPSFELLDAANPARSVIDWGERCKQLISVGKTDFASREGCLMARMLPLPSVFLNAVPQGQVPEVLTALNSIAEGIARQAMGEDPPTVHAFASLCAIEQYALGLMQKQPGYALVNFHNEPNRAKTVAAASRLIEKDQQWLAQITNDNFLNQSSSNSRDFTDFQGQIQISHQPILQPALNISSLVTITERGFKPMQDLPVSTLDFYWDNGLIPNAKQSFFKASVDHEIPLNLRPPIYAKDVAHEVTNRYATEYCCLGCIRDNCPAYNQVSKENMRFHPLFMLHNYVDEFCKNLVESKRLHRDEAAELLYTQQTNQNPNSVWKEKHGQRHATKAATGFDAEDHRLQVMNTLSIYLDNPHFFRELDLCWHFETRMFNNQSFQELLKNEEAINEHFPFLISAFKKLNKEILVSNASGDLEVAAYLIHIADRLVDLIKSQTSLEKEQKEALCAPFSFEGETLFLKWTKDLLHKTDEKSEQVRKKVIPLLMSRIYQKFIDNPSDPFFEDTNELKQVIIFAGTMGGVRDVIDPEIYERFQGLMVAMIPKIKKLVEKEEKKDEFISSILLIMNPELASLGLTWDISNLPTISSQDPATAKVHHFDLSTGSYTIEGENFKELPDKIKRDPLIKRLFGEEINSNWIVKGSLKGDPGPKTLEFTHPKFPDNRILFKDKNGLNTDSKKKEISIQKLLLNPLGGKEWMTLKYYDEQDRFINGNEFSDEPDLPSQIVQLIEDKLCWANTAGTLLSVFDTESDKKFAEIRIKREVDKQGMVQVSIEDVFLEEDKSHLLKPEKSDLERFSVIDDPHFILVKGEKDVAAEVNFSRLKLATSEAPLSYHLAEGSITSPAFPGYQLAPFGMLPGKRDLAIGATPLPPAFDGFHLLQKEGEEKVLIPFSSFAPEISAEGEPLRSSKPEFSQNYQKISVYEFKVDPETNRLLAPTGDGYAFLAYLCMAHWDYSSAAYYLNLAKTSAGYHENYDQIFDWINSWEDTTPNGVALKLRFKLLQEQISEERCSRAIAEGKVQVLDNEQFAQSERLTDFADLYEKYWEQTGSQKPDEEGRSAALNLTNEQAFEISGYIKKLIDERGNQRVTSNEPKPVRAELAPSQDYGFKDKKTATGILEGAFSLWLFKGNKKFQSPFAWKEDPQWVLKSFPNLFNQLIENPAESLNFKQVLNQIRMISENDLSEINPEEKEQIENAQGYLLKLATAKINVPGFDESFRRLVLNKMGEKCPQIKGPWLKSRRAKRLAVFSLVTEDGGAFGPLLQGNFTKEQISQTLSELAEGGGSGATKKEKEKIKTEKFLAKNALKFLKDKKTPEDGIEFQEAFKKFVIGKILGKDSAETLLNYDLIFKYLEGIAIEQPKQFLAPLPPKPKQPSLTYRQKYGPLLKKHRFSFNRSNLEKLEKEIKKSKKAASPKKIKTPSGKKQPILKTGFLKGFSIVSKKAKKVNESLFDTLAHSKEKAFQRLAKEHQMDLHAYLKETQSAKITRKSGEALQKKLVIEKKATAKKREELQGFLRQYVDRMNTPAGIVALRRMAGAGVKPSLEVLIAMWRRGEITSSWKGHPFNQIGLQKMTPEVLEELDETIAEFLKIDAKYHHLERSLLACESYLESCGNKKEALGDSQLAQELWEGLTTRRQFSLEDADGRDLLYLEYSLGIVLRPQQVDVLREMLFDPNAVRQLIMGGGKSKVLLPMLAKRKATGKNLVMLLLPDELYETNCRDLDGTNRLLFNQEMHRFDFSRNSVRSEEAFLKTYEMLLKTVKEKGFVMTTKSSLLSFKNAYIEQLNKLQFLPSEKIIERKKITDEIRAMSKIMKLFQDQTDVIADEIDACLDVRKEVNASLGEADLVDKVKVDIGNELMGRILKAKKGEKLYRLRHAVIKNAQATLAPKKRQKLLQTLTEAYYQDHQDELSKFPSKAFTSYVMDTKPKGDVRDWVLELEKINPELYYKITTLKAFINKGFGTTLGRIGNVNYGRDPISGIWTIPYKVSNTPQINSEFDDDIERLAFTYQDYLQNGVGYQQVYSSIARMLKGAGNELRAAEDATLLTLGDTECGKEFAIFLKEIDPTGKLGPLNLVSAVTPKRIEAIVKHINKSPERKHSFCYRQIASNMKLFGAQIYSNSQDLVEMVHSFGGFTGTPWNLHTYHDKIHAEKSTGVDGKTWALMLGRKIPIHTFEFDAEKPVDSLVKGLDVVGNYQAVIDTGAFLKGIDNHEFIDTCLKEGAEKKVKIGGGIYFDKTGRIVKKTSLEEKAQPIEMAQESDKMTNITLYDQGHTVGADIKQGKTAKAIVTIGENTFIRDLFQAVWRLRQLHQEQRVELALSKEIKERILNEKTEGNLKEVTLDDILKFCLQNEANREGEDNYRAEKEKINGTAKRMALSQMVAIASGESSDETIFKLAKKLATPEANLFIKVRPQEEAYVEYGQITTQEKPEKIFKSLRKKAAAQCRDLEDRFKKISSKAAKKCREKGKEVLNRKNPPSDWSPNQVNSATASEGGEVETEAQAETENTLELMTETETVQETEIAAEVIIPMAQSGAAGHGDVNPLDQLHISQLVQNWNAWDEAGLRPMGGVVPFFDETIFCSAVFERNLPGNKGGNPVPPQSMFYSNRKPIKFAMIAKNANGQWGMVIPTIHEGHRAIRQWIKNSPYPAVEIQISPTSPLILYKSGGDHTEALPFSEDEKKKFYRFYVQAKLLNGEITFEGEDEKEALKAWLKEKGVGAFSKYFTNYILAAKPNRIRNDYPKSSLFKIIDELSKEGASPE